MYSDKITQFLHIKDEVPEGVDPEKWYSDLNHDLLIAFEEFRAKGLPIPMEYKRDYIVITSRIIQLYWAYLRSQYKYKDFELNILRDSRKGE